MMTQLRFDEEMIDKYVEHECSFQIEYDNKGDLIFNGRI